jgi:AraC-like DNA-binding protein
MTAAAVTMVGTAWFGPWWLVYRGPVGPTDVHAHHALQAVAGPSVVLERAGVAVAAPVVIEPNQPHRIVDGGDAVLVYVDGDLVRRRTHPVDAWRERDAPASWEEAAALADAVLGSPPRRSGSLPPVVARASEILGDPHDDRSLGAIAADLGISPSRLCHAFTDAVGTPMRTYRRWQRLVLAAQAIAGGAGLTAAAHAAGFADGPHLARTFRRHFGLSVRELTQAVQFSTT